MVSDSSSSADRAKNFGILGSAFGFGFVIGPAVGGLLSKYGLQVPFYFASIVSLLGVLCSIFLLKETNTQKKSTPEAHQYTAIFVALATILKRPIVGTAVFIGFLLTMAQFTMIIGFQTFSVDILKIDPAKMGVFFAGFAIVGICAQLAVPLLTRLVPSRSLILLVTTLLCCIGMALAGFANGFLFFAASLILYGLFNGFRNPMLNAIIADHNQQSKQGQVLGINQSYASIGQTLGPITAGFAVLLSVHAIFFLSALYIFIALLFSVRLRSKEKD
jgi:MFS family permease